MNVVMLLDIPSSIVPEDLVLVFGDETHTYESLRAAVARTGGLLDELGVESGDRVGIFATNCLEYVEVLYACAARGATAVPMNFRAKTEEAAHLMADSGSKVVFAQARYRELIESVKPDSVEAVIWFDGDSGARSAQEAGSKSDYPQRRDAVEWEPGMDLGDADDEDLAYLLYTSGTTSMPKGVMLTHGALSGYVLGSAECADGGEQGTTLIAAPLYHVAGLTSLLLSVYGGRTVVLLPQFETRTWLEAVEQHRATHAFLVPTMLARVLDEADFAKRDVSSLELVTYGAAPMPPSVIRRAIEAFPSSVGFSQAYGQTETTATVTVLGVDDHRLDGTPEEVEVKLRRLSSVGKPLDDVELRVVDPDGMVLGPDEVGEVQLRTARTMEGYWHSDEKTRVTVDEEHWVHTGDLGFLDDEGYLFLAGRSSDMIIRGGENIAPEEVEAILYEHPDVVEAAVVGVPDVEWGERVVAAVVLRPDSTLTPEALSELCHERLASFKRPERILLMDTLPRTSTGKLIRRDLLPVVQDAVR